MYSECWMVMYKFASVSMDSCLDNCSVGSLLSYGDVLSDYGRKLVLIW